MMGQELYGKQPGSRENILHPLQGKIFGAFYIHNHNIELMVIQVFIKAECLN